MQLDDLKNTWKREITMENKMTEFAEMRRRADKLDRQANVGWAIELLTCVVMIIFILLRWLVWPPAEELNLLFQLGMLALILSVSFVAVKIVVARKVTIIDDWTLSSKINIQIEKREKEVKLLKTVAFWYLTPLFIAVILGSYGGYAQRTGSYIPGTGLWMYWTVCLGLYIGIYFFNQYHLKTKVEPILDHLYVMKCELES